MVADQDKTLRVSLGQFFQQQLEDLQVSDAAILRSVEQTHHAPFGA